MKTVPASGWYEQIYNYWEIEQAKLKMALRLDPCRPKSASA